MVVDFKHMLEDRHRWALQHKENGGLVIGCYSAVVPEELMWACNALPVQLCLAPKSYYGKAEPYLPPYVCDCSKSILEQYLDGSYRYLDGLVLSHVCETIRGIGGICRFTDPSKFVHVFTAPADYARGARTYIRDELTYLEKKLEERGGARLRGESLLEAIACYNENRRLIKELYRVRAENPGSFPPDQVLAAVITSNLLPKPLHNKMLGDFLKEGREPSSGSGPRIILSGLLFENEICESNYFFSIIEECGGRVIWDDLASGMRYRLKETEDPHRGDPLDILVENLMGPQQAPTRSHVEIKARRLLNAAENYRADGVIFAVPKYCDPVLFDIPPLKRVLEDNGYPALYLEMSGAVSEGRLRTRLEAFFEMLEGGDSVWT